MSNYSTSYNISQNGDLFTLQDHGTTSGLAKYNSTAGTTINSPLNYRKLEAFRGVDNEFFFFIKNQDRKAIDLNNIEINTSVVFRETRSSIINKKCQITDYNLGACKLILRSSDLHNAEPGIYDLILTYTDNQGLILPLYADTNMRPSLTLEISNDSFIIPKTTEVIDTFLTSGLNKVSGKIPGPSKLHKKNGLVTFAVYCTGYTGRFYLQGTTSEYPDETDWFNIELGALVDWHYFNNFTGIEPFIITSNLSYLRVFWENSGNGTVDKVLVRL